jgi:RIO-like serine/threonine protein kinase
MDYTDFRILQAISDLKIAYPRAENINYLLNLDPEELGARLGGLEMQGFVKTRSGSEDSDLCLPNGISAVSLTNLGRRALMGERWQ